MPGDITSLGPVGTSPNGDAATVTGSVLNLEPADASNPGVVTAGAQTLGGNKAFTGSVSAANGFIGSPLVMGTTGAFAGVIEATTNVMPGTIELKLNPTTSVGTLQLDGGGFPSLFIPPSSEIIASFIYAADTYNTGINMDDVAGVSMFSTSGPCANFGTYVAWGAVGASGSNPFAVLLETTTNWTVGDLLRVNNHLSNIKFSVDFAGNITSAGETRTQDVEMPAIATPTTPASGFKRLYFSSGDQKLHFVDSGGTDHIVAST
jgi:hypothetical protein